MAFAQSPLWVSFVVFALAAAVVWFAGTRLSQCVDAIARRTGIGHAFAGMFLLGGITALPEGATIATAAAESNPTLALNNLFGSIVVNLMLLAVADAVFGRRALTSVVGEPETLLQAMLVIFGLALAAVIIIAGDREIFLVSVGSSTILVFVIGAFWLSFGYNKRSPWTLKGAELRSANAWSPSDTHRAKDESGRNGESVRSFPKLLAATAGFALAVLGGGFLLSTSADSIAEQTGIGSGMIGFVLLSFGTSLPELSTVVSAVRIGRYQMAIGDVFGANLFNLSHSFIGDAFYAKGPILAQAGPFEILAAILGIVLTAVFLVGLFERGNRTVLRMGYDSAAAIIIYAAGMALLVFAIGTP